MHTLLKQMQAKASAAATKDSVAKANLEMWSMMLDQLDKQYEQLVAAQKAREDMEARRLAMYKQADEKAAAAAAAATAQQAKATEEARAAASQPAAAPAAAQGTSSSASAPSATSSPN
jgi:peptidoglycan hydrolase CwlO-like protein